MLRAAIEKLIAGHHLSGEEAGLAVDEMLEGCPDALTASFLTLLQARGETAGELAGMALALRKRAIPVYGSGPILDIVGTGGDGANTVNLSTGAAILAAACGAQVAKHGNRSVSSQSGAADVLEALKIQIELTPEQVEFLLSLRGFVFLYAPLFHPALNAVATVRRTLRRPTAFNLLGPLLNPMSVDHLLLGVYSEALLPTMAETLAKLGTKHSMVVHGQGLDEITPLGPAKMLEVRGKTITSLDLNPEQLGCAPCSLNQLQGANAAANAHRLEAALAGEPGPIGDALCLNAGVGLYLVGVVSSIKEGVVRAREAIEDGAAHDFLRQIQSKVPLEGGVR